MKKLFLSVVLGGAFLAPHSSAHAESCADLWFKRNEIFAQNGFCFSTRLARNTFRRYECWTKNPKLSRYERDQVAAIKREERRKRCKVN